MSYEKTGSSPQTILQTYLPATQLLPALEADISRVSPSNSSNPASGHGHGRLDVPSFTRYRELWRWVERLLWRAIIIASHSCPLGSPDEQILFQLFTQYQSCSARWPPSFRSEHRSTVSTLHLRALIIRSRLPGSAPLSSSSAASVRTTSSQETVAWLPIARRVVRDYRDVLTACTQFPKAGKRNVKVEEFVDLCVAVWEASGAAGEHAGWVIDVRLSSFRVHAALPYLLRFCSVCPLRSYGGPHASHSTPIAYSATCPVSSPPRAIRNSRNGR